MNTGAIEAGVLLVDKPPGRSSFAMVRIVRRLLGIKKVGHGGTLDPFATGLLVICIGRPATKLISLVMEGTKEYEAVMELGRVSTTMDPEGDISGIGLSAEIGGDRIEQVLERFRGAISQSPPPYSAVKHAGKPLYHYARRGITIEKEPRRVTVNRLEWLDRRSSVEPARPTLRVSIVCSKGTYIRQLASDVGAALGCGAYLTDLRRLRSGPFSVEQAVSGSELFGDNGLECLGAGMLTVDSVRKLLQ